ncbi:MAG: 3-oxoacyl-[acyl-carrier-protein] synthase III C-terminal domain-containing protein, partial [Candidatus Kapaibacteriales bacterium]
FMFYLNRKERPPFCKLLGVGHSTHTDDPRFKVISQLEFIQMLPSEIQKDLVNKTGTSIYDVANTWAEMISPYRTFFSGTIDELAMFSVNRCIEDAKKKDPEFSVGQIDAIIGATNTGPQYPSLADFVKNRLPARNNSMCFDVTEACTAGVVATFVGFSMIQAGICRNVLVACSEKATELTKMENWQGSNLFGDASFAFLLQSTQNPEDASFNFFYFNSYPYSGNLELIKKTETGFVQEGRKVHLFVVKNVVETLVESVSMANINVENIKHLIFHQPSRKTLSSLEEYLLSYWKNFKGIFHKSENIGNASSASFGQLLSERYHQGLIKRDELIVCGTFGAGLSIGIMALSL